MTAPVDTRPKNEDALAAAKKVSDYEWGFSSDIEQEFAPKGLSEDTVRFISAKKNEPEWMLEWRLKAYRHWLTMDSPDWAKLNVPPIDYQDAYYYAAPKKKVELGSLDELDPEGEHHVAPLSHFAAPTDFAFDDRVGCFDLVVNASPLGMVGQPPLDFDLSHVPPGSVVYDIVTHPLDTPLLQAARAGGFRTVDGLSMLIGQAAEAFERFFYAAPPRDDGDAELRSLLGA